MTIFQAPLTSGGPPPQVNVPKELNIEDMLLYAAWIHGMKEGGVVHRLALFSYIQSHVANKADENLQTIIEKRPRHWIRSSEKKGCYILQKDAVNDMQKRFGKINEPTEFSSRTSFFRDYKGSKFKVIVVPSEGLIIEINGKKVKNGPEAIAFLAGLGQNLSDSRNSLPRKLFNWIISDNNYSWIAEYPHNQSENIVSDSIQEVILLKDEDDELSFPEGAEVYRLHRSSERSKLLIDSVKKNAIIKDKTLPCQICRFSFSKVYENLGEGFIEAHHTKPVMVN